MIGCPGVTLLGTWGGGFGTRLVVAVEESCVIFVASASHMTSRVAQTEIDKMKGTEFGKNRGGEKLRITHH